MTTENVFAEVVLDLPIDKSFHYRVSPSMISKAKAGMRVEIPFGPKRLTGYILGLTPVCAVEKTRDILSFPDEEPAVTGELLALARWMSANYLCSLGEALGSIVPAVIKAPKRPFRTDRRMPASKPQQRAGIPGFELTDAQKKAVSAIR